MVALLNEPSFLRFIGDRGVRTLEDARAYLLAGPIESYARLGFGLYLVAHRDDDTAMGICGLLKRDELEDVDIGFAFLPPFWGQGYAFEAASAVLAEAFGRLRLGRVVAITAPDNLASTRLLGKLGLRFEKKVRMAAGEAEIDLFATASPAGPQAAYDSSSASSTAVPKTRISATFDIT